MLATKTEVMKAVVQDTYGDSAVLKIAERSIPTPKDDQVLIKVEAAGLDRGTWHLMRGIPYIIRPAFGFTRPRQPVPGRDVAGRVTAVGSSVTEFAVGDAVFGIAPGSFAEFAVTEADKLLRLPEGLPFVEAAALGICREPQGKAYTSCYRPPRQVQVKNNLEPMALTAWRSNPGGLNPMLERPSIKLHTSALQPVDPCLQSSISLWANDGANGTRGPPSYWRKTRQ